MNENIVDFPVVCISCKREITDGMIYYRSNKGFICELCPGFTGGNIEPDEAG